MDNYFFTFFIFSVLIFFTTIMLISNNDTGNNLNYLKAIKICSILFPSAMSLVIVVFLFSNINESLSKNLVATETSIINSGLAILGILASVWIGLNIYNTVEKNEVTKVLDKSKIEIENITKKIEDVTKIQIESSIGESQENIDEAINHYNTLVNRYSTYDLPYILRGNFMYKKKRFKEAISDYSIALFKNSDNSYLYHDRGKCYFEIGNYNEAIQDFTKAIDSNFCLEFAIKNRAISYQKNNNFEKAIKDYTYIINSLNPDHAIYNNRGYCYSKIEDYEGAITDYNAAIRLSNGKEKTYYYNRLYANMSLSNNVEILNDIDNIISKFEPTAGLYLLRSRVNMVLGNKKEAVQDLKLYEKMTKGKDEAAMSDDDNKDN